MDALKHDERFDYAVSVVLIHEGGYSNDPADPGGETNFGITQSDLRENFKDLSSFPPDVKDLTRIEAEYFYKKVYWERYNYDAINSLTVATKVFDISVNIGPHQAHELTQRALVSCGYNDIIVDGILGPHTLAYVNEICLHGREEDLMNELIDECTLFYQHLVEEKPVLKKFLNGWLCRASWS